MPRCKQGGDCKATVGDCGLCARCMCQCSGTPREELFSKKYNPDGTKKGIGRPVGSQGVKVKAKPSVFLLLHARRPLRPFQKYERTLPSSGLLRRTLETTLVTTTRTAVLSLMARETKRNDPKILESTPQTPSHTARVALGAGRSSSGHCEPRNIFGLCSLSPPGRGKCLALGPNGKDQKRPKNKKTRPKQAPPPKTKNTPQASPSSGGRRKTKIFFTPYHSLPHALCRLGVALGPYSLD